MGIHIHDIFIISRRRVMRKKKQPIQVGRAALMENYAFGSTGGRRRRRGASADVCSVEVVGATGAFGATGACGAAGAFGATGAVGAAGACGFTGACGAAGLAYGLTGVLVSVFFM